MLDLLISAAMTWAMSALGYEHRAPVRGVVVPFPRRSDAGWSVLCATLMGAHRVIGGHVCGWPARGKR